jgi:cobalamin biosynthesis Mg chelatase CobN
VAVQTADGTWRPLSSALSTFVPIDSSTTDIKVKYTFADGTESVVTKPLISSDVYQKALDASTPSSSNPVMVIVIVLALLAIVGGGFTFIRRRA